MKKEIQPLSQCPLKIQSTIRQCPTNLLPLVSQLRDLILRTAASNPDIGPLTETLKWGQLSYLTEQTKSGTTLRLGWDKENAAFVSLFVHCQTSLVGEWRDLYEDQLTLIGNRELRIATDKPLPTDAITHCITMALTYHSRKRK